MVLYIGDKPVGLAKVVEKKVPKTKFGASVDVWIGDVDENGVLNKTTWKGALSFAGVKEIVDGGLSYAFYDCAGLTSVNLSSLTTVGNSGLEYAFRSCRALTSIDLSSLQSVGQYGLNYTFYDCASLTSADLSSLITIGTNGLSYAFRDCIALTSADLSSLTTVGDYGLNYAFYNCTALTSVNLSSLTTVGANGMSWAFYDCNLPAISFPSLTNVKTNSFGSSTSNSAFRNCTALTEIHFRADMQATIEAMSQYANKFGATNASIIFDL